MNKGKILGEGTYGKVYLSKSDNNEYAIKRNLLDKNTDFIGSIKELDILAKLKGHDNIISLHSISYGSPFEYGCISPLDKGFKDDIVYFIFERACFTLCTFIESDSFLGIHRKYAMMELLLGLEYIHHNNILHLDIKPSNILCFKDSKGNYSSKICDFGLSYVKTKQEPLDTNVISSLYRPPEIALENTDFDEKADIWSLACIFYELVTDKILFEVKKDGNDKVIREILKVYPFPIPQETLERMSKNVKNVPKNKIKRQSLNSLIGLTKKQIEDFEKVHSRKTGTYEEFKDLFTNMLAFDPKDRFTATQALDHSFFDCFRNRIEASRKKYIKTRKLKYVHVPNNSQREECASLIWNIAKHLKDFYFSIRCLFQSMSLIDRYLIYTKNEKVNVDILTMTVLYMCVKYFSHVAVDSFFETFENQIFKHIDYEQAEFFAEETEKFILKKIVKYNFYEPTLYEMADVCNYKLTNTDKLQLLKIYLNTEYMSFHNDKYITPKDIFEKFLSVKERTE